MNVLTSGNYPLYGIHFEPKNVCVGQDNCVWGLGVSRSPIVCIPTP